MNLSETPFKDINFFTREQNQGRVSKRGVLAGDVVNEAQTLGMLLLSRTSLYLHSVTEAGTQTDGTGSLGNVGAQFG
jgi:hypothetical protein